MDNPLALVIEDNGDISFIIARVLEAAGFETQIACSGDDALTRLSSIAPDVVILDLNLPRVEGAEVLRQIRADPRLSHTHVVVSTAHLHLPKHIEDMADSVLTKPIDLDQLGQMATRLAGASQIQAARA